MGMKFKRARIKVWPLKIDTRWAWKVERQALNNRWVYWMAGLEETQEEATAAAEAAKEAPCL